MTVTRADLKTELTDIDNLFLSSYKCKASDNSILDITALKPNAQHTSGIAYLQSEAHNYNFNFTLLVAPELLNTGRFSIN